MPIFERLIGRRRSDEGAGSSPKKPKKDKAIIHQSVPEEVLAPRETPINPPDPSWMEKVSVRKEDTSAPRPAPKTESAPARRASAAPAHMPAPSAPVAPTAPANAPAASATERPRFPYGWLVIVEGPGTGDWYPLERGVSHVGSGEGQTVRLDHGDGAVRSEGHAVLNYDEGHHRFVLSGPDGAGLRVNGVQTDAPAALRDGDVISLGGTALRLVALCSQNFHWSKDLQRS